jgi:hypothetical protein
MKRAFSILIAVVSSMMASCSQCPRQPRYHLSDTLSGNYLLPRPPMAQIQAIYGAGSVTNADDDELHSYLIDSRTILELDCEKDLCRTFQNATIRRRLQSDSAISPKRPLPRYDFKGIGLGASQRAVLRRWGSPFKWSPDILDEPSQNLGLPKGAKVRTLLYTPEPRDFGESVQFQIYRGRVVSMMVSNLD